MGPVYKSGSNRIGMVTPGKIQGQRLNELLRYMIEQRTILSVRMEGTDYERLTYILDMTETAGENHLIIDLPEGFNNVSRRASSWQLGFNFNGPDKLEYLFSVRGGELHDQGVRIPCPEYIERIQRRKNFRIMTPAGTRMVITTPSLKGLMDLINISLGGAYGTMAKHNLKNAREPFLKVGQRIDKLGIIFHQDNDMPEQIIVIKQAWVRRIDHDLEHNRYKYAFEFMDFESDQLAKLTQTIYHIQRQFLMRR
jgi:hypothetical protein